MLAWFLIPTGVLMIIYAEQIQRFSGDIAFAESTFGVGGTFTFIRFLGLGMSVFSMMWLGGGIDELFNATIGPLFRAPGPGA